MIPFVKTHALGNDFLLAEEANAVPRDYHALARRICHRHFGIGADGLILWKAANERFEVRIFNQDGSEAECSGNGLRCVAAYLIESGIWPREEVRLQTISGEYVLCRVSVKERLYEADMGLPSLRSEDIPFIPASPST